MVARTEVSSSTLSEGRRAVEPDDVHEVALAHHDDIRAR